MKQLLLDIFQPAPTLQRWSGILLILLLLFGIAVAMVPSGYMGPDLEINDKILHATAFLGFAVLFDIASERSFWYWQAPWLLGYGALIEILQSFVSWRTFSILDFIADAVGIALYWLIFRKWLKPKILPGKLTNSA